MCKLWHDSSFKLSHHLNDWPNDSAKASSSCLLQQNHGSRTQECTDSPGKAEVATCNNQLDQGHKNNGDDKEDQEDPPVDNTDQNQSEESVKTTRSDEVHKTDVLMVSDCFLFYSLLILHADLHVLKEWLTFRFFVTITIKSGYATKNSSNMSVCTMGKGLARLCQLNH